MATPGHGDARKLTDVLVELLVVAPCLIRARLDGRPWAPLKITSDCDRRCAFCAISMFREVFGLRRPADVLTKVRWMELHDVREVFLVNENFTSYRKNLVDLLLYDIILPALVVMEGIVRAGVPCLQPAETWFELLDAMSSTPGIVPYVDISFQYVSGPLLRWMRWFDDCALFLQLLGEVRRRSACLGIRSKAIVGFPSKTDEDLVQLESFLTEAQLDILNVFGPWGEGGIEVESHDVKLLDIEVANWLAHFWTLVEEFNVQCAVERIGETETIKVLVESDCSDDELRRRADQEGSNVKNVMILQLPDSALRPAFGDFVTVRVVDAHGIDLIAELT